MCKGDLYKCPASDVELCVNSDTSDTERKAMCTKLGTGGGGYVKNKTSNNHLGLTGGMYGQNNRDEIARNMSSICGYTVYTDSDAVQCALDLSAFENKHYMNDGPLFSNNSAINDETQSKWCLGLTTQQPNYPIPQQIKKGSCP